MTTNRRTFIQQTALGLATGAVTSAVTGVTDHLSAVPIQPRTYGVELDFRF